MKSQNISFVAGLMCTEIICMYGEIRPISVAAVQPYDLDMENEEHWTLKVRDLVPVGQGCDSSYLRVRYWMYRYCVCCVALLLVLALALVLPMYRRFMGRKEKIKAPWLVMARCHLQLEGLALT